DTRPPLPSRAELEKLTTDLPRLWHAPTTSNKDRKRLLRTLIADITLLPETNPTQARIWIRSHTASCDQLPADPPLRPHPPPVHRPHPHAPRRHTTPTRPPNRQPQRPRAHHTPRAPLPHPPPQVDPPRLPLPRPSALRHR